MWRSNRRISYVHLPKQRSLTDSSLYFRFMFLFALSHLCDVPKYLSRRFAKHFYYVVLRDFLQSMLEKKKVFFPARNYGPVG